MEKIEYLYHYTSLESFALIIKNRTIRLNSLDKMDDLQEQKTADVANLGKYIFISSWTDDSVESIPMWRMYTNPASGVRIKLRKNPFMWHDTTAEDIVQKTGIPLTPDSDPNGRIHTFINLADMMEKGFYAVEGFKGEILRQVTYTDDVSLLEPRVFKQDHEGTTLSLGLLGLHKSTYWAFQHEWRYRMQIIPVNFRLSPDRMEESFKYTMMQMIQGVGKPPFSHYDLDIDPNAFSEMEIMCSPQMTYGNRVILEALVEKYNPQAIVQKSKLQGKI